MTGSADIGSFPFVRAFQRSLGATLFGSQADAVGDLQREYGDAYTADFERHARLLADAFPERQASEWLARCFQRLSSTILREEIAFRNTGQYSAEGEEMATVVRNVYDNPDVMEGYYLVGLYASYFLWPHHYRLLRFYREEFIAQAPHLPDRVMEWGTGHGMLTLQALSAWPQSRATLIDLSPHSIEFCSRLLDAANLRGRCETRLADVLACDDLPTSDCIICGELLEHVPDPPALVRKLAGCLQRNGRAFITGAINAPQPDHLFLFRSADELVKLVEGEGLRIVSQLTVRHPLREGWDTAPEVAAMVVEHAI